MVVRRAQATSPGTKVSSAWNCPPVWPRGRHIYWIVVHVHQHEQVHVVLRQSFYE